MTKEERKYLRAIFHHFDDRADKSTLPDYEELVKNHNSLKALLKSIYLTLCIQGDEDGDVIPMLEDIIKENNIKFVD